MSILIVTKLELTAKILMGPKKRQSLYLPGNFIHIECKIGQVKQNFHYFLIFFNISLSFNYKDSHLQLFGRLYHECIVYNYAKIETGRLNYIRNNQKNIRADLYKNVHDAFVNGYQTNQTGKAIILPSYFSGGPRHMEKLFQDAMACVRIHGKPDLFVTFTTNPKWPEIQCE